MAQRRRGLKWLVLAAVLLGVGAWLALSGETAETAEKPNIYLPRSATPAEREKVKERRTIAEALPTVLPDASVVMPQKSLRPRDPMLAAMPAKFEKGAVVVEANALRHSDLGTLMIDCFFSGRDTEALTRTADAGFDLLNDLDRVAVVDDSAMITGDFSRTDFSKFGSGKRTSTRWGTDTELFVSDDAEVKVVGLWKKQMLFFAGTVEDARRISDRLEGRLDQDVAPGLTESQAYGEIYGKVNPAQMAEAVEEENPQLAQLIRAAASNIELHVDASHDVGVVADIGGTQPGQTEELRKALGVALSLARLKAKADGKTREAELMEMTKVARADRQGSFRLEMGMPYDYLAKEFKQCAERKRAEAAADAGTRSK